MVVGRHLHEVEFMTAQVSSLRIPALPQTIVGQRWRNAGTRGQVRWLIHKSTRVPTGKDKGNKSQPRALHAIKFGHTTWTCRFRGLFVWQGARWTQHSTYRLNGQPRQVESVRGLPNLANQSTFQGVPGQLEAYQGLPTSVYLTWYTVH